MDKKKQRSLNIWLKQQSKLAKRWLMLAVGLGVLSSVFLLAQAALLASILHQLIIEHVDKHELIPYFVGLAVTIAIRAGCSWARELAGFRAGQQIRIYIRQLIFDKLRALGPAYIKGKPAGAWATLTLEQVENMHDFFARYLPQMSLSVLIPFVILIVVFPVNWAAGLIFLITAPLVPLFMALVGIKAADAGRKNFKALQRLSGHFYDRLQSMTTIRLFDRTSAETEQMKGASEVFRKRTMDVLRIAFLSSAVLEFFTSISIAITAVYFGFSFIGELNFGGYGASVTLFAGIFVLVLAPEFYQPLRDLGTFYHAKQQAVGAAESIVEFLNIDVSRVQSGSQTLPEMQGVEIVARDLEVFSPEGKRLVGPLTFTLNSQQTTALVGPSGAGKTSLINAILGFMPYRGSLSINGIELSELDHAHWRKQISWVGQNPLLVHGTIRDNVTLGKSNIADAQVQAVLDSSFAAEFVSKHGLDYPISDRSGGLSVGQAQRLALARAMLQNGQFWLLDEPTASLDARSEQLVMQGLNQQITHKTALLVTHQLLPLKSVNQILVMQDGQLVQAGDYATLSQQDGLFATMLASNQALQEANKGNLDA
ncbi:cysteine/glutathione ABC transporter permease/ATP-binding protein CydD [Vibrio fluvialis]|jgi:ATP-binding cassette subfamily C protein CydD|uniref:heme ABC transporter permease/ATP-binding protein CydD n=1 Tax=Vibrio fluvialis TaxID=676 RepID=UPI001C9CB609|nr:cysteine/glutathione ABC transporter permease/ATP-binding protein CydD [Vibrio fluvialis]EKO3367817.1 cysteine/glutathione ABC transporter permease/ATP-binding protein CydD [Vibrio fluvialis]EKO3555493.1 cysteine/glutathione ABC transporter permease/ATP-binding protein CydD [Vibrio fluvialis]ELI5720715.1 cysteine/glutathione ABC transporter permease/ATP-binding protein CydD [Vibrio fluvialis]ELI5739645.1 cysteine/glutathione ABC transporter permease/ATP-binding protein CydD [Vibrio fluvialis